MCTRASGAALRAETKEGKDLVWRTFETLCVSRAVEGFLLLAALDHKGICLTKYFLCVGRVGILCQDGLEVCVSHVPVSVSLRSVPHYLQRAR